MKKRTLLAVILSAAFMSGHALAGPASEVLGVCMVNYLNGKERKELGKWIFLGMSAHPEIAHLTNATDSIRDESDQYIGNLITRLLTEDCVTETKTAMAEDSSVAIASAFELVGRVAMQELTTDVTVSSALSRFEKYLDNEKFQSLQTPN